MNTHSTIRKFRVAGVQPKTFVEFQLDHEYYGHNDFSTWLSATMIGPRGGRGKSYVVASVPGQDVEFAREKLINHLTKNLDRIIGELFVRRIYRR